MTTKAAPLQLIWYQIQQESVYYITEIYPLKKQQHSNNLAHLYALYDPILKSEAPGKGFQPLPPTPPLPSAQSKVCVFFQLIIT